MTYLSFVMVSRNDNYGGNLEHRMNTCIDSIVSLSEKFDISSEILIIEWNPPREKKRLSDSLSWPERTENVEINIITVPNELHQELPNSESIPIFEYIGKNVGIRRAKGEYILSTNPDLIFSQEIMKYLSKEKLRPGSFYRANKANLSGLVPRDANLNEKLSFCKNNVKTFLSADGHSFSHWGYRDKVKWWMKDNIARKIVDPKDFYLKSKYGHLLSMVHQMLSSNFRPYSVYDLHYEASGDFILMSKEDWKMIRGHPETDHNFHIDTYTLIKAASKGLSEIDLNQCVYHQPHDNDHDIRPRPNWTSVVQDSWNVLAKNEPLDMDNPDWGLKEQDLERKTVISP